MQVAYSKSASFVLAAVLGGCLAVLPPAQITPLEEFYNTTGGAGWTCSTGWMSGDPCANGWCGVFCDSGGDTVTWVTLYAI
jgi:hypothetical protein